MIESLDVDTVTIETAVAARATLGESPVWSRRSGRLLWVDTLAPALHRFDPATGEDEVLPVPDVIGFVAEDPEGNLVVAQGCDVARLSPDGALHRFASAPDGGPGFRLNDGKFDRQGRLWLGLMADDLAEGSGVLYRFDPDSRWSRQDDGFTLVNGLDWSRDGRTLYLTDSRRGELYAYPFDQRSGDLGPRRIFARVDQDVGKPDGLIVDDRDRVLSVLFDGSAILRFTPDGRVERKIPLPVPRPTSCAFASDGALYVTTATLDLDAAARAAAPHSGGLLRLDAESLR